jgi:WD40 repeat protein
MGGLSTNEAELLSALAVSLDRHAYSKQIKKLVYCVIANRWQNEAEEMPVPELARYLGMLLERYPSSGQLAQNLERIVVRLNHRERYTKLAGEIIRGLESFYAPLNPSPNLTEDTEDGGTFFTDDLPQDSIKRDCTIWFYFEEMRPNGLVKLTVQLERKEGTVPLPVTIGLTGLRAEIERYDNWRKLYRGLDLSILSTIDASSSNNQCRDAGEFLKMGLHNWYGSTDFQLIRDKILNLVDREDRVTIAIASYDKSILQLPWHVFFQPFLTSHPHGEVIISLDRLLPLSSGSDGSARVVGLLAALASSDNIKLDRSLEFLNSLPSTDAKIIVEPSLVEFVETLTQKTFSAALLSSHNSDFMTNKEWHVNSKERVSIAKFKTCLEMSITRGLKLLVINCREGMDLVADLLDLPLPQLVVFREALPEAVALEFYKLLCKFLADGQLLSTAVRNAREKLQAIESTFPAASWLPVICQKEYLPPQTWQQLSHPVPLPSIELSDLPSLERTPVAIVSTSNKAASSLDTSNLSDGDLGDAMPPVLTLAPDSEFQQIEAELRQAEKPKNRRLTYTQISRLKQLKGFQSDARALVFSPDLQYIISGHGHRERTDNSIRVWSRQSGELVRDFQGHFDRVTSLAIAADSQCIVSGSIDGKIRGWDIFTNAAIPLEIDNYHGVKALVLSPDGQYSIIGSDDGSLQVWDIHSCKKAFEIDAHDGSITSLAISADGQVIVSGSEDRSSKVWNLRTRALIHSLNAHEDRVNCVAISPDGRSVVTGGRDRTIIVWDIFTGSLIQAISGHEKPLTAVAISPDGKIVFTASEDRTVKVWQVEDGSLINLISGHDTPIYSLAVSLDGMTIATGGEGEIFLWNVDS